MTAYVIAEIEITDTAGYEDYKKMAPSSVAGYDGKFVARDGHALPWKARNRTRCDDRFPSMTRARQWWDSAEHRAA